MSEKLRYVKRSQRDYSLSLKLRIVQQIERGELSTKSAHRTYGIQSRAKAGLGKASLILKKGGYAVISINCEEGINTMYVGKQFGGKIFIDITNNRQKKLP